MIGRTLGHYHVVEKIGAGGMGEVYRARDAKLAREVAIKVLPQAFAGDPERLGRFEQEARLLASLNHPNIATIHGLEESEGQRFLVLELVPGKTLAERLAAGPLPLEETLGLCHQIAEALEAAHQKGIIHRDLKPSNIKVTPEGKVKVLDFGLAKAFGPEGAATNLSSSPTATYSGSREGVILGTAAYMSPEQTRGKPLDKRTDIWSFGCVLYEALTGKQPFSGETVSDTLAAILKADPDWSALPANTPPLVRDVLRRSLQKEPARRLHDIADARLELDEALAAPLWSTTAAEPAALVRDWRWVLPWALVVLLVLALALATQYRASPQPAVSLATKRFALTLPPNQTLDDLGQPLALSPDGNILVYTASAEGRPTRLYLRRMDHLEATVIPGTEGASTPFFSPDGQWMGFFTADKLRKVSVLGGVPVTLCSSRVRFGADWGSDDTIVFAPTYGSGLAKVSAQGGEAEPLTRLSTSEGERQHAWPQILPGGKTVLFTISTGVSFESGRIAVQQIDTGERRIVIEDGSYGRYLHSGHLLYVRGGSVLAAPFDLARLEVAGPAVPVLEGVRTERYGEAYLAVSDDGSLLYAPGSAYGNERVLVWVNQNGSVQPLALAKRAFALPRLSPDGQKLAVSINDGGTFSIWLYDLRRETFSRLTSEKSSAFPIWSPDGKFIAFSSDALGPMSIFRKPADGGAAEPLTRAEYPQIPTAWSPDGAALLVTEIHPTAAGDIFLLPLKGEHQPDFLVRTPNDEYNGVFSPDGGWLGFTSSESGGDEVYVRPYRGTAGKTQVSSGGADEPLWAPNGRELFYRNGNALMVVDVVVGTTFRAGKPRILFQGNFDHGPDGMNNYDITPDGQRFVMIKSEQESAPTQINVVLNWFEELKRRVPAGKK